MSEETKAADAAQQQQVIQLPVDASKLQTVYANFFRVVGTPEELILDFGLHTQQMNAGGPEPVRLTTQLVVGYYTAKRLMAALQQAVRMHENSFGVLETDFRRRMRGQPAPQGGGFGN
jgi:hypothetical protein